MDAWETRRARVGVALLVAVATFALFSRAGGNRFLFFDDDQYVTMNPVVSSGVTAGGVRWAFTTLRLGNWHPLAWLSHMLDVQVFGMDPAAHHLVNAGLHATNAAVLFLVLARMTGASIPSVVVALLFAFHPLHVESVAWVSERKDLLSTLFGFLALGAYARFAGRPSPSRMLLVLLFLLGSLLSKAMWITAPFVFLLLDGWPLQRVETAGIPADPRPPAAPRRSPFRLIVEKLPILVLCAAVGIVAVLAQARGGALNDLEQVGVLDRIGNAALSYFRYLRLAVWPAGLSAWYPLRPGTIRGAGALAAVTLVVSVPVALWIGRRMPWIRVGWLWYLGMLVPVIGLVQVGSQAMADRYTYVPLTGVFIGVAWTADAVARTRRSRLALGAVAATAILVLAGATWNRIGDWKDQVTLFSRALAVTGPDGHVHHILSQGYLAEGRWGEAVQHAREAARLDPANPRTHKNLGFALYRAGQVAEAAASLEQAIRLDPGYAEAHANLAIVYGRLGRLDAAVQEMRISRQLGEGPAPR